MIRISMTATPLLLLLSCVSAPTDPEPTKEALALAAGLDGMTAGEPVSCISNMSSRSLRAVDESTLVVRAGRTLYVNRLGYRCGGMEPDDTLIVRSFSSQLCRGDTIEPRSFGLSDIAGPRCVLSNFIPYRATQDETEAGVDTE